MTAISVGVSGPGTCIAVTVVVARLWWRRRWMRRRRLAGQRQEIALERLPLNLSLYVVGYNDEFFACCSG